MISAKSYPKRFEIIPPPFNLIIEGRKRTVYGSKPFFLFFSPFFAENRQNRRYSHFWRFIDLLFSSYQIYNSYLKTSDSDWLFVQPTGFLNVASNFTWQLKSRFHSNSRQVRARERRASTCGAAPAPGARDAPIQPPHTTMASGRRLSPRPRTRTRLWVQAEPNDLSAARLGKARCPPIRRRRRVVDYTPQGT